MEKELSGLSLTELWELFPVSLVPHNDKWNIYYDEMEIFLKNILSECQIQRISHIGSTAVPWIWAKDIVDILIEASENSDIETIASIIEQNGFVRMSTEGDRIDRKSVV